MRMWMVDSRILCQKHLCGEHVELHMFLGHLNRGRKIDGYIDNNLIEPKSIYQRHFELAVEMSNRGYNHKSHITNSECQCILKLPEDQRDNKINKEDALEELLNRCDLCKERYERLRNAEF